MVIFICDLHLEALNLSRPTEISQQHYAFFIQKAEAERVAQEQLAHQSELCTQFKLLAMN
jgi:hypothetical protein